MGKSVFLRPNCYSEVKRELIKRLQEPGPTHCQIVSGPRQVGKTTLLLEIVALWPDRVIYVAADSHEAGLPGWWENLWRDAKQKATQRQIILLIDEIHYFPNWSHFLKAQLDEIKRKRIFLRVVISGSSALKLGAGAKEGLSGRFERLPLQHWSFSEMRQLTTEAAPLTIDDFVRTGGYPGGIPLRENKERWKRYIWDSIVEPALGRDVMALEVIRKPALLRQIFSIAAGHPAEIISIQKLVGLLAGQGAMDTVVHYLQVLQEIGLVAAIDKFSTHTIRQKASPPKLIVLNQGILGATHAEWPTAAAQPKEWGRWVENACLAHAINSSQDVFYWRQEPIEADMIIKGTWGQWAVEIKSGNWCLGDLKGILTFCEQHPTFKPLLLCDKGDVGETNFPGLTVQSWQSFLENGPVET